MPVLVTHARMHCMREEQRDARMVAVGSCSVPTVAAPISALQLERLHRDRYLVVPNWLSAAQIARLQTDAVAVDRVGGFECHVGAAALGTPRLDLQTRQSRQCTIIPPQSNAAGSVATRANLLAAVDQLRGELQRSALMALPRLEPYATELNYLLYPVGGHYVRHLDATVPNAGWQRIGRRATDGGSFGGGHTRRVISFILYLNSGWDAGDGGALRVFPAREILSHLPDDAQGTAHLEDVEPEGGTLVLLMSAEVEHQVRVTRAERQCVVGWFREYARLERTPDLAPTALRTFRRLDKRTTNGFCASRADELALS